MEYLVTVQENKADVFLNFMKALDFVKIRENKSESITIDYQRGKAKTQTTDPDIIKAAEEWEMNPDDLEIIMDVSRKINRNIAKHWDKRFQTI